VPITVGSNVFAIKAQRYLLKATDEVESSIERLASGQRINKAADDPAGLAIAEALLSDRRLMTVAILNTNQGLSMIQVADDALATIGNVLNRMRELAAQSSTGTYLNTQRSAMEAEFVALGSEIERIAVTARFNNINLLSGLQTTVLQVGITGQSWSQLFVRFGGGTLQDIRLASANASQLNYTLLGATREEAQANSRTAHEAVRLAIELLGSKRGELGGNQNRLEFALQSLESSRANFTAAESRIRDLDTAAEIAQLVQAQVRQQAAAAILSQANLQPRLVLDLLRDT
jgi:flagellin